eukprot:13023997-Ditylum_brightwellii.AAC.2
MLPLPLNLCHVYQPNPDLSLPPLSASLPTKSLTVKLAVPPAWYILEILSWMLLATDTASCLLWKYPPTPTGNLVNFWKEMP